MVLVVLVVLLVLLLGVRSSSSTITTTTTTTTRSSSSTTGSPDIDVLQESLQTALSQEKTNARWLPVFRCGSPRSSKPPCHSMTLRNKR